MNVLDEKTQKELERIFDALDNDVNLVFFTQEIECRFCKDTRLLLEDLSSVSSKIKVKTLDFVNDKKEADKYGVDKIPAIVVLDGDKDPGIKFYGIPGGYEFASIIETIKMVSTGDNPLEQSTLDFLKSLKNEVHFQVFVTPTCPYCPAAVVLAHRFAFASPLVKSDMVEATEFPELSVKYKVMGVPRTVINETVFQEGAAPEGMLIEKIKESL